MRQRPCKTCGQPARTDGSCKVEGCSNWRGTLVGWHWRYKRAAAVIGEGVAPRLGAYVVGGFASALLHRHDIRVAIASGMFLKVVVPDTAKRLELLMALYPCYWKWSTAAVLRHLILHMDELLGDPCPHILAPLVLFPCQFEGNNLPERQTKDISW